MLINASPALALPVHDIEDTRISARPHVLQIALESSELLENRQKYNNRKLAEAKRAKNKRAIAEWEEKIAITERKLQYALRQEQTDEQKKKKSNQKTSTAKSVVQDQHKKSLEKLAQDSERLIKEVTKQKVTVSKPQSSAKTADTTPVAGIAKLPSCPKTECIWNVPAKGGTIPNNKSCDILLMVAPKEKITGAISGEVPYKGVVMIGAEFAKVGTNKAAGPKGQALNGGDVLKIGFAANNKHANPFLYLANIDFQTKDSYWGDFIKTGSKSSDTRKWPDIFLSNSRVSGHYFWSSTTPGYKEKTHSDVFQSPAGGWRSLSVSNVETEWTGQHWYVVPTRAGKKAHPQGQVVLKNVVMKPAPQSNKIYGEQRDVKYIAAYNVRVSPSSHYKVHTSNTYITPNGNQKLSSMYGPNYAIKSAPKLTSNPPSVVNNSRLGLKGRVTNLKELQGYCK